MRMFSPLSFGHTGILLALTLSPALNAGAEPLGRLFHTPAARARLDQPPPRDTAPAPPPRLDGIITRSDGQPVIFLDGQATPADARQIRMNEASALVTGPDGRHHRLHVGYSTVSTGAP